MTKTISIPASLACAQIGELRPDFFKALGDPVRLALVAYMARLGKPSTVTQVSGCCGIDFSGVSRHLKILREAGIVTAKKRGRETLYALDLDLLTTTLRGVSNCLENLTE